MKAILTLAESDDFGRCGRRRRFPQGTTIVKEGEQARHVAAILVGRVKVSCFSDDGREVILGALGSGDFVGEFSAIDGEPCSATVTSLELVEAVVLDRASFVAFLDSHPRVMRVLLIRMTRKLRDADRQRVEFGTLDIEGRVARLLIQMASQYSAHTGGCITLPLSQQELAGWTCSSREAVSRALRSFRDCGWVETHRRSITILDATALRRRGGSHPLVRDSEDATLRRGISVEATSLHHETPKLHDRNKLGNSQPGR